MNCEHFYDIVYEYLDGTLPPSEKQAAERHVEECGACGRAVGREKALAASLQRATAGLALRPQTKEKLLSRPIPRAWVSPWWWIAAGACALLVLMAGRRFVPSSPPPRAAYATRWTVDVPIETERYVFQNPGTTVVDAVVVNPDTIQYVTPK